MLLYPAKYLRNPSRVYIIKPRRFFGYSSLKLLIMWVSVYYIFLSVRANHQLTCLIIYNRDLSWCARLSNMTLPLYNDQTSVRPMHRKRIRIKIPSKTLESACPLSLYLYSLERVALAALSPHCAESLDIHRFLFRAPWIGHTASPSTIINYPSFNCTVL